MNTIAQNIQETIDLLAAVVRARKAFENCRASEAGRFLASIAEEESQLRESLNHWINAQLQQQFGILKGQHIRIRDQSFLIEGTVTKLRISFRFTDVTAVPCFEIELAGEINHQVILDPQMKIQVVRPLKLLKTA